MNNIYVDRYRSILKEHQKKIRQFRSEIESVREKYTEDYQKEMIDSIEKEMAKVSEQNKARIIRLHNDVISQIAKSSFPNVESLTADRILFENNALKLTPPEVAVYIDRYKRNNTMLRIIEEWLVQYHKADTEMNDYTDCYLSIVSPDKKADAYLTYAKSAIDMINRIDSTPAVSDAFVDSYGDETVGYKLYRVIGDGLDISDYKNKKVSDSIEESFNAYRLSESVLERSDNVFYSE